MAEETKVLTLCTEVGRALLMSGGEIHRVQDTMERIAAAYGVRDFHVYVLTNGLFASVGTENGQHSSEIRHVPTSAVHLGRVAEINALSRAIAAGEVTLEEAFVRLEAARSLPFAAKASRLLACAVGSGCFAFLFGGTVLDAAAAFVTGLVLELFVFVLERHHADKIIHNILAAALVALCSALCKEALGFFALSANLDKIIIGGIIPLVPGMALTTSIRDFAGGDYLSGTIRLIDALLVAGSIAIGVGAVLAVLAYLPGVSL